MAEQQSMLDRWFLQQEIIDQLLGQGEEREDAEEFGQRIATIAATEEAEHQSLHDPFDRSVALVLSLVREEEFNPGCGPLSVPERLCKAGERRRKP